jgi:hypothetical protein
MWSRRTSSRKRPGSQAARARDRLWRHGARQNARGARWASATANRSRSGLSVSPRPSRASAIALVSKAPASLNALMGAFRQRCPSRAPACGTQPRGPVRERPQAAGKRTVGKSRRTPRRCPAIAQACCRTRRLWEHPRCRSRAISPLSRCGRTRIQIDRTFLGRVKGNHSTSILWQQLAGVDFRDPTPMINGHVHFASTTDPRGLTPTGRGRRMAAAARDPHAIMFTWQQRATYERLRGLLAANQVPAHRPAPPTPGPARPAARSRRADPPAHLRE